MNYPIWDVPYLGVTGIIGLISCFHICIVNFAVGGGMYFAVTEQWAYKTNDEGVYDFLKRLSKFFLLLTTVAGAVSGIGIWWAVSLGNPNSIHTLIQTFTLGWAEEWVFFIAELATAFVYYYTWGKISKEQHLKLAWFYAVFSVLTLVIINGILSFMMTPGAWLTTKNWLLGFFNETYWPLLFMRLVVFAAAAGMYAFVVAARIQDEATKTKVLQYTTKWFIPLFIIGPLVGFWYFKNLPPDAVTNVMTGIQASGVGNFSILARTFYLSLIMTGTILVFAFVGPYLNPKGFSFHAAVLFLLCGLFVTSIGEFTREMLRKPYVIYGYMYSNGIVKDKVPELNKVGYLKSSKWVHDGMTPVEIGESMFKSQCLMCHTRHGYRSMERLLGERDEQSITAFLQMLQMTDKEKNPYVGIMPPLVGTPDEVAALATYLSALTGTAANPPVKQTAALPYKPVLVK
ncbi:MAG: cytochrome ubiquinol oxidase subunit I [Cyanobacteria bacterium HKST-UBA04]|nr:cytochrome ubiquinol oxidase subunit I [Cyanobacteria bacterium HKST-UBA04]